MCTVLLWEVSTTNIADALGELNRAVNVGFAKLKVGWPC